MPALAPYALLQTSRSVLLARYRAVRQETEALCAPLVPEDYVIQSFADASPPKWHLAHATWFFENFLLAAYLSDYQRFHPRFGYLFNSYYETVGAFYPRLQRGLLSRPTVEDVYRYRTYVDSFMAEAMERVTDSAWSEFAARVTLGLHHEQQHQELLLTDILHNFAVNPLRPVYHEAALPRRSAPPLAWREHPAGVYAVGYDGDGFAFDNETPRHRVFLESFRLASRLVTNGEYLEFMDASGYQKPALWLSDGWKTVREKNWGAPLHWELIDGRWWQMTLSGMQQVNEHAPVCHVSLFEADAFARWRGKRLPTEAEWEVAAACEPIAGNLREAGFLQPVTADEGVTQFYGDVWEWTRSAYGPYPGYLPLAGALGEYNGKFMCSQLVLRGGSCATPSSHVRSTYRNFFYPADRWQFSGIRLAE